MQAFFLSFLLACSSGGDSAEEEPLPYAPYDPGPWAPGTRMGAFLNDSGEEAEIYVWYPAQETDDGTAEHARYAGLLEGSALEQSTPACDVARGVVLFSHGSQGLPYQSIFLTERLASHGWIVVAPEHVGNTTFDHDDDRIGELVVRRPADVADAFDWLLSASADPEEDLYGCADPDAGYAVVGHSFGGYTALAVAGATLDIEGLQEECGDSTDGWCGTLNAWVAAHPGETEGDLSDPRAWASVPMAPAGADAFGDGVAAIDVPITILAGTLDTATPAETEAKVMYAGLEAVPRGLGVLIDAGHMAFSNMCDFYAAYEECLAPYIASEDGHRIINEIVVPFLDLAQGDPRGADWLPPPEQALTWTWVE